MTRIPSGFRCRAFLNFRSPAALDTCQLGHRTMREKFRQRTASAQQCIRIVCHASHKTNRASHRDTAYYKPSEHEARLALRCIRYDTHPCLAPCTLIAGLCYRLRDGFPLSWCSSFPVDTGGLPSAGVRAIMQVLRDAGAALLNDGNVLRHV